MPHAVSAVSIGLVLSALSLACSVQAAGQGWRDTAAHLGTTARVLLVGTRPPDEDNALITWLSLGRHVETAYLSLTRGESGANMVGNERQFPLAVLRTAELLAERERDGAHQYFTRAYDVGRTDADSDVAAAWPFDSLLRDVTAVVRAFRPHVIIALSDSAGERDATRRLTARLVAAAFAAAADTTIRERAVHGMLGAAGLVIDGTAAHELVAAGDSVPVDISIYNGGGAAVRIGRVAATQGTVLSVLVRDSGIVVAPDGTLPLHANVRVLGPDYHWWQIHGLVAGTMLHNVHAAQWIEGEDRIPGSRVEITVAIGGVDVPVIVEPIVHRDATALRGDRRHPVVVVPATNVLLERGAEYERAGLPIDRLFRVYVWSARSTPDTVALTLFVPAGLRTDSAMRSVALPPFGSRNVFFWLRGTLRPGADTLHVLGRTVTSAPAGTGAVVRVGSGTVFRLGVVTRDYPHVPSQQYVRFADDRIEVVDLRVPPQLRVAYVKGSDDVQTALLQLRVSTQVVDPALLAAVNLSGFNAMLVRSGALTGDALTAALPALRAFVRGGGTLVILAASEEIARSGLMPYPISADSLPRRIAGAGAALRADDPRAPLLVWPNEIRPRDLAGIGMTGRAVPHALDPRYRVVLSATDARRKLSLPMLLSARDGKGTVIYTSLPLDDALAATDPGAARLLLNLLSAGLASLASR